MLGTSPWTGTSGAVPGWVWGPRSRPSQLGVGLRGHGRGRRGTGGSPRPPCPGNVPRRAGSACRERRIPAAGPADRVTCRHEPGSALPINLPLVTLCNLPLQSPLNARAGPRPGAGGARKYGPCQEQVLRAWPRGRGSRPSKQRDGWAGSAPLSSPAGPAGTDYARPGGAHLSRRPGPGLPTGPPHGTPPRDPRSGPRRPRPRHEAQEGPEVWWCLGAAWLRSGRGARLTRY